jgi:hypothetical protein
MVAAAAKCAMAPLALELRAGSRCPARELGERGYDAAIGRFSTD